MAAPNDEPRIRELEALRAPTRRETERLRARERILAEAGPLLARRWQPRSSLDVLAGWARPGLIAAGVALAVLVGAWQAGGRGAAVSDPPIVLDEVLSGGVGSGEVPALLLAVTEPDANALVEAALLEQNSNGGDNK